MGKIIAVANQKGGVGKTTTAINLSAGLAEKEKKVLLVDLDSQSNATSGVGIEKSEVDNSTYELISGDASFADTVISSEFRNLDVLPSSTDLTAAEIELLDEDGRESKLKVILDPVKKDYDFIIIDCPPSLNMLTVNSLTAADSVLIPIQCEYYALEGLSQLLQTISLVKERINPRLRIEGIVFTMYDSRLRLSRQVVQNVKENLNEKMFRTMIPRNVRLAEAPSHGQPIMQYTRFCAGTRAYRNLAKEIIAANPTTMETQPVNPQADHNLELDQEAEKPYVIKEENDNLENNPDLADTLIEENDNLENNSDTVETQNEENENLEEKADSSDVIKEEAGSKAPDDQLKESATTNPERTINVKEPSESVSDKEESDDSQPKNTDEAPEAEADENTDEAPEAEVDENTDEAPDAETDQNPDEAPEAETDEGTKGDQEAENVETAEKENLSKTKKKETFESLMERAEKEIGRWN